MAARLAPLLLFVLVVSGCKSMGGLGSGLGHVASDMGHVAGEVSHVTGSVGRVTGETLAHATPVIARGAGQVVKHTVPIAEDVLDAAVLTSPDTDPVEVQVRSPQDGPLIDNHDPCAQCPEDLDCGSCVGYGDAACILTPAGAYARCESQLP